MRACFDGDPLPRRLEEQLDRAARSRRHTSFTDYRTISVQRAVVAEPITEIDSHDHNTLPVDSLLLHLCHCPRLRSSHFARLFHGPSPFFFVP
jgi:hypothetical protein